MIPLGSPAVDEAEIEAVTRALEAGELSVGNRVAEFEAAFAEFVGRDDGAAVCSGSVALELAFEASSLEPGDAVVVSPFNCSAVLYSLVRRGLEPVFADIETETYNIDPDAVGGVADDADGLLLTHLYGQPSHIDPLLDVARAADLTVVEDFAQAPGAAYRGRNVGTYGEASVCSFGATKNLTTAEGGMVLSDDGSRTAAVRTRRSNTNGDFEEPLWSVRMNDLEAAIGIQQLEKYDDILERKRRVARIYRDGLPGALDLPVEREDRTHVYHGFAVRSAERDALADHLDANDVGNAAVYDTPLHRYACADTTRRFPRAEATAESVLLLPIHGSMSVGDARRVVDVVREFH